MRGKRKLKVHWVNGVEETHKKKTDQTPQHHRALNQTTHQNQSTTPLTNQPHQKRCGEKSRGGREKWSLGEWEESVKDTGWIG